jgi:hypothetical protein
LPYAHYLAATRPGSSMNSYVDRSQSAFRTVFLEAMLVPPRTLRLCSGVDPVDMVSLQPRTAFKEVDEESRCKVTGRSVHPELMRRRLIIAMALTLVLAAIVVALFVVGPPSMAASGGCGGG